MLTIDSATLDRLLTWRLAHQDLLLALQQGGADIEWLERLLENPLFAKVPPANVQSMLARLQRVELAAGSQVLELSLIHILSITECTERLGCAPYGRHTLIRCAHPLGLPAACYSAALRFGLLTGPRRELA